MGRFDGKIRLEGSMDRPVVGAVGRLDDVGVVVAVGEDVQRVHRPPERLEHLDASACVCARVRVSVRACA